jgi:hypothetical protein
LDTGYNIRTNFALVTGGTELTTGQRTIEAVGDLFAEWIVRQGPRWYVRQKPGRRPEPWAQRLAEWCRHPGRTESELLRMLDGSCWRFRLAGSTACR